MVLTLIIPQRTCVEDPYPPVRLRRDSGSFRSWDQLKEMKSLVHTLTSTIGTRLGSLLSQLHCEMNIDLLHHVLPQ